MESITAEMLTATAPSMNLERKEDSRYELERKEKSARDLEEVKPIVEFIKPRMQESLDKFLAEPTWANSRQLRKFMELLTSYTSEY